METLQPVLDTSLDAAIVMRVDGVVAGWNRVAETTFGWTQQEAIGQLLAELIVPADLREAHTIGLQQYRNTGQGPVLNQRIEIFARHKDGREFPVELAITATQAAGEEVFLGFLRDISARKSAESALRESEQRLKATYENAFVSIAETDADANFLHMNAQLPRITGYSEAELRERTFFDITHPDDVEHDRALYRRQWNGELENYTVEKRYVRKDGDLVWVEVRASLVRDESRQPLYAIRVVRDISERKQAEVYQQLLIAELNHRVKNVLAIVNGLAYQTFKNHKTEEFRSFSGRLNAVATAHDVITEAKWEYADFGEIVRIVTEPYQSIDGYRIAIAGPSLSLTPRTGVMLSMAIYELATNAAKYGSLTAETGLVEITWSVEDGNSGRTLCLRWQERGGPPVVEPKRRGFGMLLIERGLAAELKSEIQLDFQPGGVVCTVKAVIPSDGPLQGKQL